MNLRTLMAAIEYHLEAADGEPQPEECEPDSEGTPRSGWRFTSAMRELPKESGLLTFGLNSVTEGVHFRESVTHLSVHGASFGNWGTPVMAADAEGKLGLLLKVPVWPDGCKDYNPCDDHPLGWTVAWQPDPGDPTCSLSPALDHNGEWGFVCTDMVGRIAFEAPLKTLWSFPRAKLEPPAFQAYFSATISVGLPRAGSEEQSGFFITAWDTTGAIWLISEGEDKVKLEAEEGWGVARCGLGNLAVWELDGLFSTDVGCVVGLFGTDSGYLAFLVREGEGHRLIGARLPEKESDQQ